MTSAGRSREKLLLQAMAVQFCFAISYLWSVFQPYAMSRFHLDMAQAAKPYGVLQAAFVLGNIVSGHLQERQRFAHIIVGGSAVMCLGMALAAFVPVDKPYLLQLTFGVMGGFGAGVGYNALLAAMQRWFPDKRGLVTGLVLGVVAAGGMLMSLWASYLLARSGFMTAMLGVAAVFAVLSLPFGRLIDAPDVLVVQEGSEADFTPRRMLGTWQFYLVSGGFFLAVPAYFLLSPMIMVLGEQRGLSHAAALTGVMLLSVANAAGRLIIPALSDHIGCRRTILGVFAFNILVLAPLTVARGYGFLALVGCVAFAYGGFMGVYPALTTEYFGQAHNGYNYALVMLGFGLAALGCPYLVAAVQQTIWGTALSFVLAGAACVLGGALTLCLRKPSLVKEKEDVENEGSSLYGG